jgi:hypothetical protein
VWINPFWEDDVNEIVDLMGDDRVIFGSDWPHIEGLPEPTDWVTELQKLPASRCQDHGRQRVRTQRAPARMTEVVDQSETVDSAEPGYQIEPHVIILFGATGDLAARKLLPGLLHLASRDDARVPHRRQLDEHPDRRGVPAPGPPRVSTSSRRTRSRCCSGPTSRSG